MSYQIPYNQAQTNSNIPQFQSQQFFSTASGKCIYN